ncbi:DEAD/DEAH box helicase family protein [Clostridium botulinum]|uniref:DEAD/DEAH box helicase family protein n=1 Tax=Clostridium botulinum TaxID=1491 RepID=UPI00174AD557|nr:DEAD/DEAH box helicase family protein [Clostridium botulinum]MBD5589178.1 hypothetical protein [Clostridium botulinum]
MLETSNFNESKFYNDEFTFLYDYQRKVVEDKNSTVIVNWSRGLGKTFTAMCKVLKSRPKRVLYVAPINSFFVYFCSKIDEIKKLSDDSNIKNIKTNKTNDKYYTSLCVEHEDGNISEIYWYKDEETRNLKSHFDLIIFDESLPYNIPNISTSQIISFNSFNNGYKALTRRMFSVNVSVHETTEEDFKQFNKNVNCNWLKKLRIDDFINYYDEFEIYSIPEIGDINNYIFLKESLNKLQNEFSKIPNCNNTVMTREKLLDMILKIKYELKKEN